MTTTPIEIRDQVLEILGDDFEIYDVRGITRELVETFDLIGDNPRDTVAGIASATYWGIVAKYQHPDA